MISIGHHLHALAHATTGTHVLAFWTKVSVHRSSGRARYNRLLSKLLYMEMRRNKVQHIYSRKTANDIAGVLAWTLSMVMGRMIAHTSLIPLCSLFHMLNDHGIFNRIRYIVKRRDLFLIMTHNQLCILPQDTIPPNASPKIKITRTVPCRPTKSVQTKNAARNSHLRNIRFRCSVNGDLASSH